MLDSTISAWVKVVTDQDLDHVLHYANSKGVISDKQFFSLVMHFFNHQTHHRGQATTLLMQAGVDVGVTDLLMLIPNEGPSERRISDKTQGKEQTILYNAARYLT